MKRPEVQTVSPPPISDATSPMATSGEVKSGPGGKPPERQELGVGETQVDPLNAHCPTGRCTNRFDT